MKQARLSLLSFGLSMLLFAVSRPAAAECISGSLRYSTGARITKSAGKCQECTSSGAWIAKTCEGCGPDTKASQGKARQKPAADRAICVFKSKEYSEGDTVTGGGACLRCRPVGDWGVRTCADCGAATSRPAQPEK